MDDLFVSQGAVESMKNIQEGNNIIKEFYDSLTDENCVELVNSFVRSGKVNVNHIFNENFIDLPNKGRTALHFAGQHGKLQLVKCLLDLGADQCIADKKGEIPLHVVCKHGQYECVQVLLEYDNSLKDKQNKQGLTPLMKAIYRSETVFMVKNYKWTIGILISAGCDTNLCPLSNMSPLHYAAGTWQGTQLVNTLIKAGAEVNRNTDISSPLMTAISKNKTVNTDIVRALINAGADVNYKNPSKRSVLHVAVAKSLDISVKDLLAAGADANSLDSEGISPLWVAVCENNISIAPLLLEYGANVNYAHKQFNMSLLCRASSNGNEKMVKLLLDHNADVNMSTILGATPLHYAVDNNDICIVKLLLSKNCALDNYSSFKDLNNPMNALQIAFSRGDDEMIQLLMLAGFPVFESEINQASLPCTVKEDEELVNWIYKYFYNPQSLQHICRLKLRRLYLTGIIDIVEKLMIDSHIPRRVGELVLMTDLLNAKKIKSDLCYDEYDDHDDYDEY